MRCHLQINCFWSDWIEFKKKTMMIELDVYRIQRINSHTDSYNSTQTQSFISKCLNFLIENSMLASVIHSHNILNRLRNRKTFQYFLAFMNDKIRSTSKLLHLWKKQINYSIAGYRRRRRWWWWWWKEKLERKEILRMEIWVNGILSDLSRLTSLFPYLSHKNNDDKQW